MKKKDNLYTIFGSSGFFGRNLHKSLKEKKIYFLSCLSAKNKPIKKRAVQPRPNKALNGLVYEIHRINTKAPKIKPLIKIIITKVVLCMFRPLVIFYYLMHFIFKFSFRLKIKFFFYSLYINFRFIKNNI